MSEMQHLEGDSDKDDPEEMDVSGGEEEDIPRRRRSVPSEGEVLKEENDNLRCQMEAYKNEVDLVKADLRTEVSSRDDQIMALKKALQAMQQTLSDNAIRRRQDENRSTTVDRISPTVVTTSDSDPEDITAAPLADKIAWLIGLVSTFLHIHPKGASVDYIWSYLQQFDKSIRSAEIEALLNQYSSVFRLLTTGVGACLERKWVFTGFKQE